MLLRCAHDDGLTRYGQRSRQESDSRDWLHRYVRGWEHLADDMGNDHCDVVGLDAKGRPPTKLHHRQRRVDHLRHDGRSSLPPNIVTRSKSWLTSSRCANSKL